jgi:signal transduction histidine kinase
MATVHGIVTRFGGSVGVYSEVGKGATLTVYLPRAEAVETMAGTTAPLAGTDAPPCRE